MDEYCQDDTKQGHNDHAWQYTCSQDTSCEDPQVMWLSTETLDTFRVIADSAYKHPTEPPESGRVCSPPSLGKCDWNVKYSRSQDRCQPDHTVSAQTPYNRSLLFNSFRCQLYVMLMMKHRKDMPTTRSFTVRATESFFIYYDLVLIMSWTWIKILNRSSTVMSPRLPTC